MRATINQTQFVTDLAELDALDEIPTAQETRFYRRFTDEPAEQARAQSWVPSYDEWHPHAADEFDVQRLPLVRATFAAMRLYGETLAHFGDDSDEAHQMRARLLAITTEQARFGFDPEDDRELERERLFIEQLHKARAYADDHHHGRVKRCHAKQATAELKKLERERQAVMA